MVKVTDRCSDTDMIMTIVTKITIVNKRLAVTSIATMIHLMLRGTRPPSHVSLMEFPPETRDVTAVTSILHQDCVCDL